MEKILANLIDRTIYGNEDSDSHLMSLFGITLGCKPKRVLELGVREGTTTLPLLAATSLVHGQMTSVDINETEFVPPDLLKPYWTFIHGDALTFLANATGVYDVVFVDDWHSYPHVKKELEYLESLVTPSSVILLHDLMYGGYQPSYHSELNTSNPEWADGGPHRAVNELDKDKWEFSTIPCSHGLTLLRKKH